jgi:hypothetical protein
MYLLLRLKGPMRDWTLTSKAGYQNGTNAILGRHAREGANRIHRPGLRLASARVAFAPIAGMTSLQVSNRTRWRATAGDMGSGSGLVLQDSLPDALTIMLGHSAAFVLCGPAAETSGQIETPPCPSRPPYTETP